MLKNTSGSNLIISVPAEMLVHSPYGFEVLTDNSWWNMFSCGVLKSGSAQLLLHRISDNKTWINSYRSVSVRDFEFEKAMIDRLHTVIVGLVSIEKDTYGIINTLDKWGNVGVTMVDPRPNIDEYKIDITRN